MEKIIILADAWGTKYGGINSFNCDLCLNLSLILDCEKCVVICATCNDPLNEYELRKADEVNLRIYNFAKVDFKSDTIIKKLITHNEDVVWWVGHDIITGELALKCARKTNSQCAVIHHMDYEAYYNLVNSNADIVNKKINLQKHILNAADKVFAVGPKLTKSVREKLNCSNGENSKVYELIPGLAQIEPIESINSRFKAITFGRLSLSEKDIIKQSILAVQSFATVVSRLGLSIDNTLTLIGYNSTEKNEEVKSSLNKIALKYAGRVVNIMPRSYIEDRHELFEILKNSSVCMMLSLHEGFGLAGWEAISAGIPLILSKNSGLFEFLHDKGLNLKVCAVDIRGSITEDANINDVQKVSDELIEIQKSFGTYKKTAIELRKELIAQGYTWENTALSFVRGLGIESRNQAKQRKIVDKIRETMIGISAIKCDNIDWDKITNEFENSQKYIRIRDAYDDIANDLQNSSFLNVHGMRGSTFCPENDNSITAVLNSRTIDVKILTMYPFSEYIYQRLITLPNFQKSEKELKRHHQDLYNTAKSFSLHADYVIKFFKFPLLFRLIFTGSSLYLSLYEDGIYARDSNVFKFQSNTKTYSIFITYFDAMWSQSIGELPTKAEDVSSEYRFIFNQSFVKPSLVINICASCNMGCEYCPTGGENLITINSKEYISTKQIINLVKLFPSCGGNPVLRITGGEPLLNKEVRQRTSNILRAALKNNYDKIVLCTNAIFFKEAYNENHQIWDSIKEKLLLKISLDTLNEDTFSLMTKCDSNLLGEIKNNIIFAKSNGFKIELNMVATIFNVKEVIPIYEFAKKHQLIGVKVLTINDFGGRISINETERKKVEDKLIEIIEILKGQGVDEHDVALNDGVGIKMKRLVCTNNVDQKCTLTIVDHNTKSNSITTRRLFCEFCKNCKFYPCATGIMNLTLRSDGMLSQCRLKVDQMVDIKHTSCGKLKVLIDDLLKPFSNCFWLDVRGNSNEEI